MILLFLATFLANVQTLQVPLTSSLFLEDRNTLEGRIKNAGKDGVQTVHLSNAEMITRTIQVASEDILLIGNNTTLAYCVEGSSSEKKNEWKDRMFMFSVWNSSFRVEGVRAFCITNQTGVCLISSSNVYFSLSTLISDGYHSPFLVCSSKGNNDQSSSLIVLSKCTYESPTHLVPPFVDVWHSRNDGENSASQSKSEHIGGPESISVVGTGILISSKTLWMGTGPLFSFGMAPNDHRDFGSVCVTSMDTNMNFCELVNMSSRTDVFSDFGKSGKKLRDFRQQIVGSSVCLSSNHDRGTGMLDANAGGSLSCVNTSFSSCVREVNSETEKSESFTEFVLGDRFSIDNTSLLTSVSYTLCSFNEMTADVGNGKGGAAISLFQTKASLTVTQCFFHKCTVTGRNNEGGAVFVRYYYDSLNPVTISKSSFTECKANSSNKYGVNHAAALYVYLTSQLTLDGCFFESCSAQYNGVVYTHMSPTSLSNCAFELCSADYSGGALSITAPGSVVLSSLQFRECVCLWTPASKDIYFGTSSSAINTTSITYYDSSSGSPNVLFETRESDLEDSTLVPQLVEYMLTEITSFEVLVGEDKATITIKTRSAVKGVMGVLLEGSNVPRLVHVEFGTADTSSSTGTAEVSIGRQGVLPILTDGQSYSIRSVSIPGWSIVGSILDLSARLKGTSEASFELTGCFLTTRPYSMKVKDSENNEFTIPLSFLSGSLTGTSSLSSIDPTKLKYEWYYDVVEVLYGSQSLVLIHAFSFYIPFPLATLSGIEQTDGTDSMTIAFLGSGLVASGYTVTLIEQGGGESPHTKTVNLVPSSESRLTPWTAKLSPILEADLKYGTDYEMSYFNSIEGCQAVERDTITFRTPNEPSCLTNVSFSRLYDDEKKAEVSVEGRVMSVGETYTLHLNETGTQTGAKMNVSFSSATNGKGTGIVFSQTEEEIELEYETNYTVVNVTDSSNNGVLFASGLTFKTDAEPTRLVSFSVVGLDSGGKRVLFGMSGRKLNSDEIYEVELSKSGTTRFTVEMKWNGESGRWEGSGVAYPVEGAELEFGEVLDVKRFLQQGGSTDLLCEGGSVTISDEPARLVSLKSSDEEGLNETTVTVETRALEVGKDYTLTLSGTSLSSPSSSNDVDTRTIHLVPTSETSYVFSLSLYPLTSADLLFGHTYSASSMAIGSNVSILIETAECSFSTPIEPERVVSVSAGNFGSTSLNSTIDLSFSSRALLPSTEYTLTFTSTASQDRQTHSKTLRLRTTENGVLECHEAVLYPFETEESKRNSQFEFETTYVLSSFERGSTELLFDTEMISFVIQKEPTRIERFIKAELNKDTTVVRLFFEGRALHYSIGLIWLNDGSTFWSSVSSLTTTDSTHCHADFSVSSEESAEKVQFDKEYTISINTGETTTFIVNDGIKARIPLPPRLLSASFAFANTLLTSCSVSFVGSDLPIEKDFRVTLSLSHSFEVRVVDAEHAKSSQLRIGWSDSLQFNTKYTISSIVGLDGESGEIMFDPSLSFETEAGLEEIHLFVDSSSGSSEWFCGVKSQPCSTIEAAWWIVDGIRVSKVTLDIVHNTIQSKQIVISKGMEVGLKSGETTKPELFVSDLPTLEDEEMISVTEASLLIHHVDVEFASSPSLIFVVVLNGSLTLESSSFVGSSQSPSPTSNSELFSCSWTSGAFVLKNSTTKLVSSSFSHLTSGALNLKGGTLSVETSAFHDNSPNDHLFPSARRNIHCSDGGNLTIGSLNGGDGSSDKHPHLWLSHEDCVLSGEDVNVNAPFFIPTLSSSESSSKFSKQNKSFSIWIVGSTLIPCDLCLEVFEIVSSKTEKEGKAESFALSSDSTEWKNETHISVSISLSSLSSLDSSLEWRGRLLFGSASKSASDSSSEKETQSSDLLRTSESFQIQSSISQRRSESVKENMKWWLPLVISLCVVLLLSMIVVFICWRRRGKKAMRNKATVKMKEMDNEDEARLELEQKMEETIPENSDDHLIKIQQTVNPNPNQPNPTSISLPMETPQFVEVLGESGEVGVVDWTNVDTLFDILHRPEKQRAIDKRTMSRRVAKTLERVWKEHKTSELVTRFSPHWVLVNNSSVLLRLAPIEEGREETDVKNQDETQKQEREQKQNQECEKSFFGEGLSAATRKAAEGLRWRAPEIGRWNGEKIDGESALVFSLGLVLWEIWTGEVPWKEMDEANATRQNEGGEKPNMKLVLDEEIRNLISWSLSLDPKERPSLKSVVSVLCSEEAADEHVEIPKASDQLDIRS